MRHVGVLLAIVWAAPWSLFGLTVGVLGLLTGGRVQRTGRVLEFWGGGATWFLKTFPLVRGAQAVTFGHVVLARSREAVEMTRRHERVHVAQYERWGVAFVPAYLFHWVRLMLARKDPYLDNPFEREAFAATEPFWDRPS